MWKGANRENTCNHRFHFLPNPSSQADSRELHLTQVSRGQFLEQTGWSGLLSSVPCTSPSPRKGGKGRNLRERQRNREWDKARTVFGDLLSYPYDLPCLVGGWSQLDRGRNHEFLTSPSRRLGRWGKGKAVGSAKRSPRPYGCKLVFWPQHTLQRPGMKWWVRKITLTSKQHWVQMGNYPHVTRHPESRHYVLYLENTDVITMPTVDWSTGDPWRLLAHHELLPTVDAGPSPSAVICGSSEPANTQS